MDVIEEMLHVALRDDSTATVGIRALLGHVATPYGVYHSNDLPDNLDFTGGKKYISHFQLTGDYDMSYPRGNFSTMPKQETYQISVYGGKGTTSNDKILARIRYRLEGKNKTTNPTADAKVFDIRCEWEGPELYDEDYKEFYKQSRFRVWLQDIMITG